MFDISIIAVLIAIGAAVGVTAGLLGVGGGAIMVARIYRLVYGQRRS